MLKLMIVILLVLNVLLIQRYTDDILVVTATKLASLTIRIP